MVPETAGLSELPIRDVGLPAQLAPPTAAKVALLSAQPIPRAVALLETREGVFVLGVDGSYRMLAGIEVSSRPWVQASSLTPDGSRGILMHSNLLAVVDFPTGQVHRFDVTGSNTQVAWLPDGRVLYAQGDRSMVLDPSTGVIRPVAYNANEIAVNSTPELVQLDPAAAGIPARLLTWSPSESDSQPPGPVNGPLPQGTPRTKRDLQLSKGLQWIGYWEGSGWLHGDLLARACSASGMHMPTGYGTPQFATVVVDLSGKLHGVLAQQSVHATYPLAPVILGWLDEGTVLLRLGDSSYRPLIGWEVATGALSLVSNLHSETKIAVASLG
jgi:hypothetical protein